MKILKNNVSYLNVLEYSYKWNTNRLKATDTPNDIHLIFKPVDKQQLNWRTKANVIFIYCELHAVRFSFILQIFQRKLDNLRRLTDLDSLKKWKISDGGGSIDKRGKRGWLDEKGRNPTANAISCWSCVHKQSPQQKPRLIHKNNQRATITRKDNNNNKSKKQNQR